ncbi:MAG: hypothetical protein ACOYZ7_18110 [Chloroflexota bacterium]
MTEDFSSEWLPGYVIVPRKGGHAWQIGIIQDSRGSRRVRLASGRMSIVENPDPSGPPLAAVKQTNRVNVTDLEEWDRVAAAVRQKLEELAAMKDQPKE